MPSIAVVTAVRPARDLAHRLLADRPERLQHTAGVAQRAAELRPAVGDDEEHETLVAAAWLHDIGYADALHDTGFHPLDGARHLDREGWPRRLSALVAHHSGACFVARARGLDEALRAYPREDSPVADALTYADQTVGPGGIRMDVRCRMADMLHRHGPASANAVVHHVRGPYLLAVADRVEHRLTR
ncbi:HD domain-containing protein [Jidongwangia harbinensis]|uniref:HD domain-containing protein n=1 Tax=Jidongwangia harbinensis TaxID=2878561 RepID=UPI001CD94480|nr:HD domain-containing protein [Jidongwangia harbinensis]MCA2214164.1 HD domain-containing protein [Jidongwangia harbinensis]